MTKPLPVKELDVIEVLPGCLFPGLVYSKGIVRESLNFMSCVVEFPADKRSADGALMETFQGRYWCIPWKYLKVLDSAYGNSVAELEELLENLQDDLTVARSCITISEELREMQQEQISRMIVEIDMLKAEIYYLKGGR